MIVFLMMAFLFVSVNASVNFKGLIQNWFSISSQDFGDGTSDSIYGFANRRIRLAPYGSLGRKIRWGVQFAFDKFNTPTVLDAYIDYFISREAIIRFGKFAAPGSTSGALTSSGALDLIERSAITQLWGINSGLHAYRAIGAQLSGKFLEGKLYYALMISNALTASNNWLPSGKTLTFANGHNGLGFWGRIEASPIPGLKLGGFLGSGSEADPAIVESDIKRSSYGGHLAYKKNNINFKFEYISGERSEIKYSGMSVLAGYRLNQIEPIIGFETYTTVDEGEKYTNFTAGLNYFHSKRVKLQVNYMMRSEELIDIDNDIIYFNVQYSFDSAKK